MLPDQPPSDARVLLIRLNKLLRRTLLPKVSCGNQKRSQRRFQPFADMGEAQKRTSIPREADFDNCRSVGAVTCQCPSSKAPQSGHGF